VAAEAAGHDLRALIVDEFFANYIFVTDGSLSKL
jgi:hypothetical protein